MEWTRSAHVVQQPRTPRPPDRGTGAPAVGTGQAAGARLCPGLRASWGSAGAGGRILAFGDTLPHARVPSLTPGD